MSDVLKHYGTPRHSGRYPWGSGENPYQRNKNFQSRVKELKKEGLSEAKIAERMGIKNTSELRARISIAKDEVENYEREQVIKLKDKQYSNVAIAKKLGVSEGTIRNYLKPKDTAKLNLTKASMKALEDAVAEKKYVDIGEGVERHMGITNTRLKTAVAQLRQQGYKVHYLKVRQLGTGMETSLKVLTKDDVPWSEVNKNKSKIEMPVTYSENGGETFHKIEPPKSVDKSRVMVRYAEDGGKEKDGVIELRRGVDDISLGNARYAQVRIAVNDSHFLKGMACYGDFTNVPKGTDIIFNTNKKKGTPMLGDKDNSVLKPMKNDPENPFGATIKDSSELILAQRHYKDANGKEQLSSINIVNEEGDWGKWSKNLASQFLSKQSPALAKRQLDLVYKSKAEEFEEISKLTNPVVKKKMLESFADDCDASAVHLKAAAMPRQSTHVILPFPDMDEKSIYAPRFRTGEEVILVRYPHGGTFEIPKLTVNNNIASAKKVIANSEDAVGINAKVAEQLSGADFDGDTVVVIPTVNQKLKVRRPLEGLKDFDPKEAYPAYEGMPKMKNKTKQTEMGKISNLITDMTLKGATEDEIERAVKHSMVVIDAEKHNLNYKQSFKDQGIAQLKQKYQGRTNAGASTLISKASSEERIQGVRKNNRGKIDKETGQKIYEYKDKSFIGKEGKEVKLTTKTNRMSETDDAFTLTSGGSKENPGTLMESIYATHANKLKAMANEARKEYMNTPNIKMSSEAKKKYAKEVSSLMSKLNIAEKNQPLERKAQLIGNERVRLIKENNPDMDKDDEKKLRGRELTRARKLVGAGKQRIDISDKEWEAIQAGAISTNALTKIINNTDLDKVKQLATPRTTLVMSPAKIALAKARVAAGNSLSDVADSLGISVSTLSKAIK